MAATVIFELLCLACIVLMIYFLTALHRDRRHKSQCQVVQLTLRHGETEGDSVRSATKTEAAAEDDDPAFRLRLNAIAIGRGGPLAELDEVEKPSAVYGTHNQCSAKVEAH